MAEDMDNIVVLTDEDGHDVQFEHIVTVTHKNKEYVCLIPIEGIDYGEDEDENALIFLEIIPGKDGADDVYQGVEDEKRIVRQISRSRRIRGRRRTVNPQRTQSLLNDCGRFFIERSLLQNGKKRQARPD